MLVQLKITMRMHFIFGVDLSVDTMKILSFEKVNLIILLKKVEAQFRMVRFESRSLTPIEKTKHTHTQEYTHTHIHTHLR